MKSAVRFKGIWLIVLLACAVTLIRMQDHTVYNTMMEYNKTRYLQIGRQYGLQGKYSKQKQLVLDQLYDEVKQKEERRSQAVNDYLTGKINQIDYIHKMKSTESVYDEKSVLEQYLIQYESAAGDPENRYVLYGNGWNKLLCQPYGYLSLLSSVILAVFLWMPEFDVKNRFFYFMITTKRGSKAIVREKAILLFFAVVLECSAEQFLYGTYLAGTYGFVHGTWPAQSLAVLQDSVFRMKILQAVLIQGMIRFLLMYLLALYVSVLVLLLKNVQSVLAAAGTLVVFVGLQYWQDDILLKVFCSCRAAAWSGILCILLAGYGNICLGRIWSGRK